MYRRTFIKGSLGLAATFTLPALATAAQIRSTATQTAFYTLELTVTDTGFELPDLILSARYQIVVTNAGTMKESHIALGQIPDRVTDEQYDEWLAGLASGQDSTDALSFEDIGFVGMPDWPAPGESVTGIIDLWPGRYFLFDPFAGREAMTLQIKGNLVDAAEPEADVVVELNEMEIVVPDEAITTDPVRWKIRNSGSMSHEVAVVPVPADFTEEHLQLLFTMDEDATPPPGFPEFAYQPAAAIGILAGSHTSWLDVQLAPGRYLAMCMLPFSTGYPHAMDGMYRFLDVA